MNHFLTAFQNQLNTMFPEWVVQDDQLVGPGNAIIRLGQQHSSLSPGHVDVEFVFNGQQQGIKSLWDCVTGLGKEPAFQAQTAARIWASTTAPDMKRLRLLYSSFPGLD